MGRSRSGGDFRKGYLGFEGVLGSVPVVPNIEMQRFISKGHPVMSVHILVVITRVRVLCYLKRDATKYSVI